MAKYSGGGELPPPEKLSQGNVPLPPSPVLRLCTQLRADISICRETLASKNYIHIIKLGMLFKKTLVLYIRASSTKNFYPKGKKNITQYI